MSYHAYVIQFFKWLFRICVAILIIALIVLVVLLYYDNEAYRGLAEKRLQVINDLNRTARSLEMACFGEDTVFDLNKGIEGIAYMDKGFFCVWSEGRTLTQVIDTCGHEWAHVNEGLLDPESCGVKAS